MLTVRHLGRRSSPRSAPTYEVSETYRARPRGKSGPETKAQNKHQNTNPFLLPTATRHPDTYAHGTYVRTRTQHASLNVQRRTLGCRGVLRTITVPSDRPQLQWARGPASARIPESCTITFLSARATLSSTLACAASFVSRTRGWRERPGGRSDSEGWKSEDAKTRR